MQPQRKGEQHHERHCRDSQSASQVRSVQSPTAGNKANVATKLPSITVPAAAAGGRRNLTRQIYSPELLLHINAERLISTILGTTPGTSMAASHRAAPARLLKPSMAPPKTGTQNANKSAGTASRQRKHRQCQRGLPVAADFGHHRRRIQHRRSSAAHQHRDDKHLRYAGQAVARKAFIRCRRLSRRTTSPLLIFFRNATAI